MRQTDFDRLTQLQRKKWTECTVYVDDIGEVEHSPSGGLQQKLKLIIGEGIPVTEMIYYFTDPDHSVEAYEKPNQKFKIMFIKKDDGGYWKCQPAEVKELPPDYDADTSNLEQVSVDRQTMIVRQTCIKAACELLKSVDKHGGFETALIIAKKFENYVKGK